MLGNFLNYLPSTSKSHDFFWNYEWPFNSNLNYNKKKHLELDAIDRENDVILQLNVPGFNQDDIDIKVDDNIITISAEKTNETKENSFNYIVHERRSGKFSRSIKINDDLDINTIDAKLENGVLNINIQKKNKREPKKITIK